MNWFKVFTVGVVGGVLAACNSGVIGTPPVGVDNITVSPATVQVGASQSKNLTAVVKDSAGKTLSVQVKWEVMDASVAKVATKGKLAATLTGVQAGETEVYASVGDVQSAPISVVVSGNTPTPPAPPTPPTPPSPPSPPTPPAPGGGGEVRGTIIAPAGKTVDGTLLSFCPVSDNNEVDCGAPNATGGKIPAGEKVASFPYKITLKAGRYVLFADKDVNGNGKYVEAGDYSGCYGQQGDSCLIFQPPKTGVDVKMEVVAGTGEAQGSGAGINLKVAREGHFKTQTLMRSE